MDVADSSLCEATRTGHVQQPINALSCMLCVVTGSGLLLDSVIRRDLSLVTATHGALVAVSTLGIGLSAALYHASLSYAAELWLAACWSSLACSAIRFAHRCAWVRPASRFEQLYFTGAQQLRLVAEHMALVGGLLALCCCCGQHQILLWVVFGCFSLMAYRDSNIIVQPQSRRTTLVAIAAVAIIWQCLRVLDDTLCNPKAWLQWRALARMLEAIGCVMVYFWVHQYYLKSNKYARRRLSSSKVTVDSAPPTPSPDPSPTDIDIKSD